MTDHERGIEQFTKYFVRNYPGPDTVIFDPKWHAPKIFRAAISAYLATTEPSKPVAEAVKVKPLEWQEQSDSSGEMSYWGHHQFGVYAVNRDYFSVVPWELLAGGRVIGNYDTVEAAKAAAQSYYEQRILSALAPQAGDNAEEPVAVLDDLHSAMCLLETLSEAMPTDDVSAVMMSVMANNIRQKHFVGTDAIASHPCTSTPVVSQNAPDLEDKGGENAPS